MWGRDKNFQVLMIFWLRNCGKKNSVREFLISQLENHHNLKNLVPTPHNTLVIMWDRDKNFQVLMIFELLNREKQNFNCSTFIIHYPDKTSGF